MYPLKVILVGPNLGLVPRLRCELMNCSAELEAEYPSVDKAISALRTSSADRRLLIFQMASPSSIDALEHLAERFPGWPVVVLLEGYDPKESLGEVIFGIMRAGASQILALPIQGELFRQALDRIAIQFVYSAKPAKVIAVAGVTGGCGATTVALNLAFEIAAATEGLRSILADLSLRMGVVASHLNIEPSTTILDLLRDDGPADKINAKRALIRVAENFEILAGPHEIVAPIASSPADVARVVGLLKHLADVVVLDVPCTYDDLYFDTLAAADQVLLIGEQKLPSIRALKMVREAMVRNGGSPRLVLNRFDPRNKPFAVDRLLRPLGVSRVRTVARDDAGVNSAVEAACTLRLGAPRSPALADILAIVEEIVAVDAPPRVKAEGIFSRIGRAFSNS